MPDMTVSNPGDLSNMQAYSDECSFGSCITYLLKVFQPTPFWNSTDLSASICLLKLNFCCK